MTQTEIKNGINEICEISLEVNSFYHDNSALVSKLNSVPKSDIEKAINYYAPRTGVIVDLRKEVLDYLNSGNKLDIPKLDGFVLKHKTGKENQYRAYKNYYSIFFPIITFYGHNSIRDFIDSFIKEIIIDLNIDGEVKSIYFDFQGARQQGSDRLWLAIYNIKQETQSTGLQFFLDFYKGKVKYGIYRHSDKTYVKGPVENLPNNFVYDDMIKLFAENINLIVSDVPEKDTILNIALENHRLYKISHGSFKSKSKEITLNTFIENQWIVIHENTGKGQSDAFKNELTDGDFVYITLGGNELLSLAKVKAGSWGYIPEDITGEEGWIYREVEYFKKPIKTDISDLKSFKEFIYPSGNSTLTEITVDKIDEANERIFEPFFFVHFISEDATELKANGEVVKLPNNVILFGPPGTGKTYKSIEEAVKVIQGVISLNHEENKSVFDNLKKEGQIES